MTIIDVEKHVDVIIVGAGISGIGAAVHLNMQCPNKTYSILEQRQEIGGTWDLFRYPGIRSDSDMHTLGYRFKPWLHEKAIADGPVIKEYLHDTAKQYKLRKNIRFGYRVLAAQWSGSQARWTLTVRREVDGEKQQLSANFLFMCSGYYDYAQGYKPAFKDENKFQGQVIHPQHWPADLDYANKQVIVIGSGATAVSIVPVMAETAAKVTMLQRSPTYMVSRPSIDRMALFVRKILPTKIAYAMTRWRNIWLQKLIYKKARSKPTWVGTKMIDLARKEMPKLSDFDKHFTPKYQPWEQRLCLVADSDLFKILQSDKAQIVTEQIERFTANGILLKSGRELEADIIVSATGLNLSLLGQTKLTVDNLVVDLANHVYYKGLMFNDIPNFASIFGYVNASWTLKTDIAADYVCRLLATMEQKQVTIANPHLDDPDMPRSPFIENFSSGYIARSLDKLPKNGDRHPWRLLQDYAAEKKILTRDPVDDGVMVFSNGETLAES